MSTAAPKSGQHGSDSIASPSSSSAVPRRKDVVAKEKEEYGGIKVGSAFFGWLTATGMTVRLVAVLTAAGAVVGVASNTNASEATTQATRSVEDAQTLGLVAGIALLVIMFVAYYCGGYVAGRMARFNGMKQGIAVWLWAIAIAIVAAVMVAIGGSEYNVLATLNSFPRIPVDEGAVSTGGLIALVAVAVASLVGAMLGGLAGMRYHRNVDKAGLGH